MKDKNAMQIVWQIRANEEELTNAPSISEQISGMPDGEKTWSTTHSWPFVMGILCDFRLVKNVGNRNVNGFKIPVTEITDLGREVRGIFNGK